MLFYFNTTGASNTANGFQALYSNTTGAGNVANGQRRSLFQHHWYLQNTANGYQALYSTPLVIAT